MSANLLALMLLILGASDDRSEIETLTDLEQEARSLAARTAVLTQRVEIRDLEQQLNAHRFSLIRIQLSGTDEYVAVFEIGDHRVTLHEGDLLADQLRIGEVTFDGVSVIDEREGTSRPLSFGPTTVVTGGQPSSSRPAGVGPNQPGFGG